MKGQIAKYCSMKYQKDDTAPDHRECDNSQQVRPEIFCASSSLLYLSIPGIDELVSKTEHAGLEVKLLGLGRIIVERLLK